MKETHLNTDAQTTDMKPLNAAHQRMDKQLRMKKEPRD